MKAANENLKHSQRLLVIAALGVVFGDIGTSPLYAIRECFHGEFSIAVTNSNVLGVLSLMFWSITLIVSVKYLTFILKADNHGEGGVIALTSLIRDTAKKGKRSLWVLVSAGLFAAALLYGDGMITPAISVLSAVDGVRIITPIFKPYIVAITVVILAGLFLLQHRGTAGVGKLFGPVIIVWFSVLAIFGAISIFNNPKILQALSPHYGAHFLYSNGLTGYMVLGAVFLVVTGAEALYADLGHFGRKPIRAAWFILAFPALFLNYFGQGALLLAHPEEAHHPFYGIIPVWAMIPMVILATMATIIASQAVITGAFSLTRQAIQLGYMPRLRLIHTSAKYFGQIYIPAVNWILMICTIALVLGFQSSSRLAAAYGVAVTSTMAISSLLFFNVARYKWKWNLLQALLPTLLFLSVDLMFFGANISKLLHGAWFPLVIGAAVFTLMTTWKRGREILFTDPTITAKTWDELLSEISDIKRIQGDAIYLSGREDFVPLSLTHNIYHNKVLHSNVAVMHIKTHPIPRYPNSQKIEIRKIGRGINYISANYGYMESPNMTNIIDLMRERGVEFDIKKTSFFLGRERLVISTGKGMRRWRKSLFKYMARNAADISAYFKIPVNQVIEVGVQQQL